MNLQVIGLLVFFFGAINLVRMALFLIGSDIYNLQAHLRKKRSGNNFLPTFTVIIPAHNEQNTILHCLKSVLASTYPAHLLQVIIADDGSIDNTVELVQKFRHQNKIKGLTISKRPRQGKAGALNYAIKRYAKGELIMCLDADSSLKPDSISNAVKHFTDPRVAALAANVKIRDNGTLLGLIQKFEYIICYQMKRAQTVFNIEYIIGGIGSTFRRSVLKKVGYYDTNTVTEDIDLTMKILHEGNKKMRAVYGADVITVTEPVTSFRSLIRQRYRWKFGRSQTFWKRRNLFFNTKHKYGKLLTCFYLPYAIFSDISFFFEPLLVGYIVFVIIWYDDPWTLLSALTIITTYIGINIVSEESIPWRNKPVLLLMSPAMYFLFYSLSFVEYIALIKGIYTLPTVPKSVKTETCSWQHVERSTI